MQRHSEFQVFTRNSGEHKGNIREPLEMVIAP